MTDEEKIKILATDGMLVKRPLIIGDGGVLVDLSRRNGRRVHGYR